MHAIKCLSHSHRHHIDVTDCWMFTSSITTNWHLIQSYHRRTQDTRSLSFLSTQRTLKRNFIHCINHKTSSIDKIHVCTTHGVAMMEVKQLCNKNKQHIYETIKVRMIYSYGTFSSQYGSDFHQVFIIYKYSVIVFMFNLYSFTSVNPCK